MIYITSVHEVGKMQIAFLAFFFILIFSSDRTVLEQNSDFLWLFLLACRYVSSIFVVFSVSGRYLLSK